MVKLNKNEPLRGAFKKQEVRMITMSNQFHDVTKNALFAMVDLFLDYARFEEVESQAGNITEFILDCHNIEETEPEFTLLQAKFEEEFREIDYLECMTKDELITFLQKAVYRLFHNYEPEDAPILPLLVQQAINQSKGKGAN